MVECETRPILLRVGGRSLACGFLEQVFEGQPRLNFIELERFNASRKKPTDLARHPSMRGGATRYVVSAASRSADGRLLAW